MALLPCLVVGWWLAGVVEVTRSHVLWGLQQADLDVLVWGLAAW